MARQEIPCMLSKGGYFENLYNRDLDRALQNISNWREDNEGDNISYISFCN
ncbi:MAG: hypothetical protein A4E59_02071 [Syntrophorhabdus sp. PtaB.Bin027]|jgi:hypothetical protein|nr:MAG: hypothetical protein A4E59_02071 [Syntrophorhabdus sp. PtaB.Bin027]